MRIFLYMFYITFITNVFANIWSLEIKSVNSIQLSDNWY